MPRPTRVGCSWPSTLALPPGGFFAAGESEAARKAATCRAVPHLDGSPWERIGAAAAGSDFNDFTDPAARAEAGADGGFMWCTCTVLAVENVAKGPRSVYKDGEAAWVRWDANDRVTPAEKESEGAFKLLKTRWNKPDGEGAWRLDFDDV